MRAFYVEADRVPKPGYKFSPMEERTGEALRGNQVWKNIRGLVTDRPMPECGDDQVLLRIGAAGICGTDRHEYVGPNFIPVSRPHRLTGRTAPLVIGHEITGIIEETGEEAGEWKKGDRKSVV